MTTTGKSSGATIHPFPKPGLTPTATTANQAEVALEQASERAAQAMSTLLRLVATRPQPPVSNPYASSTELSQLIDLFLKIRDPDQRRYCLAVARSCAVQDEGRR